MKDYNLFSVYLLGIQRTFATDETKQKCIDAYKNTYGTTHIENKQQFIDFMTSYIEQIGKKEH